MSAAVLITQMDIPAADEAEFNDWYTNEHVSERVDLPGFKSAYRFQATDGAPRYFAYYETDGLEALTTPTYKAILADQTDWSKSVMARFRNFGRICGLLAARAGRGHGAAALVVRATGGDALEAYLAAALTDAATAPLIVGGYLWRADPEATGDPDVAGGRVMVLEALEEAPLRQFASERLRPSDLAAAGAEDAGDASSVGYYRLISFMER